MSGYIPPPAPHLPGASSVAVPDPRSSRIYCGSIENVEYVRFRSPTGRYCTYGGTRAHVILMLVQAPDGLTQSDTLPWHTRLSETIHVFRQHGFEISTEFEGKYRRARYRLLTRGNLPVRGAGS